MTITNLRYHQLRSGIPISHLARDTGIPREQIHNYLSGLSTPRPSRRASLAAALGITEEEIVGWCDEEAVAL